MASAVSGAGVSGEPFRWDACGVDEGGLPVHLPISLDENQRGPTRDQDAYVYVCWCMDKDCLLTKALMDAWRAGMRLVTVDDRDG